MKSFVRHLIVFFGCSFDSKKEPVRIRSHCLGKGCLGRCRSNECASRPEWRESVRKHVNIGKKPIGGRIRGCRQVSKVPSNPCLWKSL